MAVTLTGTSSGSQGLFNRLGALAYRIQGAIDAANFYDSDLTNALSLFDGSNATLRGTVDGLVPKMRVAQTGANAYKSAIKAAAQATLIEMFDADSPLATRDVLNALQRLQSQMKTATTTYFEANTVSASVTATNLTGTGNVVTSTKDGLGNNLENMLAEVIRINCSSNSSAGSESIRFRGEESISDKLSHRWPLGSGCDRTLTSLVASSSSNLVSNGTFETFTVANIPDNWTIAVGSAGSQVYSESSTVYTGSKALKIAGDGSTLTQLTQTLTGLSAQVPYAVNFYCKCSGTPAAGVLTIDLYDGSAVINDEAGTANSFTVALTSLGTTYVAKSGTFRLPDPVPSTVKLRIRLSTALSNTYNLFVDNLAMQQMVQLDTSNPGATPFVSVFGGATNWSIDDGAYGGTTTWKIDAANDRVSLWQSWMDRLFDTSKLGIVFPVSGTTAISDGLIA